MKMGKVPEYRASIALSAAQVLLKSGDTSAYGRFQEIVTDEPQTLEAYQAMQALLANGNSIDPLLHGQISFADGDYSDAISALYNYTSSMQLPAIDPNAFMLLSQTYRALRSAQQA